MDVPPLLPVPPGASALPAFVGIEAWVRKERGQALAAAQLALRHARDEAERIEAEGLARLENVVVQAEKEAQRNAEDVARDRVSAARTALSRWVDAVERDVAPLVEEAVQRLVNPKAAGA